MSVRNIDQGFYSANMLNMLRSIQVGIESTDTALTVEFSTQVFQNNQQITLQIPSYTHTFTASGYVKANLPQDLWLPSSTTIYTFPIIINVNTTSTVALLILNVATGEINIFSNATATDFTSGQTVAWSSPISITYILS